MWITLLIPRIEDGNNFGVSIQEETLGEVCNCFFVYFGLRFLWSRLLEFTPKLVFWFI